MDRERYRAMTWETLLLEAAEQDACTRALAARFHGRCRQLVEGSGALETDVKAQSLRADLYLAMTAHFAGKTLCPQQFCNGPH